MEMSFGLDVLEGCTGAFCKKDRPVVASRIVGPSGGMTFKMFAAHVFASIDCFLWAACLPLTR